MDNSCHYRIPFDQSPINNLNSSVVLLSFDKSPRGLQLSNIPLSFFSSSLSLSLSISNELMKCFLFAQVLPKLSSSIVHEVDSILGNKPYSKKDYRSQESSELSKGGLSIVARTSLSLCFFTEPDVGMTDWHSHRVPGWTLVNEKWLMWIPL